MIDVAIGVFLLFLVVSVMASAVIEVVGGFFHRRGKHLWDTIDIILGKTAITEGAEERRLVDALYEQPFITGLVRPSDRRFFAPETTPATGAVGTSATPTIAPASTSIGMTPSQGDAPPKRASKKGLSGTEEKRRYYGPAHIDAKSFANSLIEVIRPGGTADTTKAGLLTDISKLPQSALKTKLVALLTNAGSTLDEARSALESWYEEQMTSVAHWYRKQTRWFLLLAGLALAASFNVDAVSATRTLFEDEAVREAVVTQAGTLAGSDCAPATTTVTSTTSAPAQPAIATSASLAQIDCFRETLGGSVAVPIGWADLDTSRGAWAIRILGWLIVGAAATLGGPFWWDLLGRALKYRRESNA